MERCAATRSAFGGAGSGAGRPAGKASAMRRVTPSPGSMRNTIASPGSDAVARAARVSLQGISCKRTRRESRSTSSAATSTQAPPADSFISQALTARPAGSPCSQIAPAAARRRSLRRSMAAPRGACSASEVSRTALTVDPQSCLLARGLRSTAPHTLRAASGMARASGPRRSCVYSQPGDVRRPGPHAAIAIGRSARRVYDQRTFGAASDRN